MSPRSGGRSPNIQSAGDVTRSLAEATPPKPVRRDIGQALYAAQRGEEYPSVKALRGFGGRSVLEIVTPCRTDSSRAVYTVRFHDAISVLRAFQKKSTTGLWPPRVRRLGDYPRGNGHDGRVSPTLREILFVQEGPMTEAVFQRDGDGFVPTPWAAGPWNTNLVQGSATAGLLAREVEAQARPFHLAVGRLTFDLWRPVPRERLHLETEWLRDGRKAKTLRASLLAAGVEVARCTAALARREAETLPPVSSAPGPGPRPAARSRTSAGGGARSSRGSTRGWSPVISSHPAPAAAWMTLVRPLVECEANSALVQAVSAADLGSGISAVVSLNTWSFVNPELTLHLWRAPRGAWILLDAETRVGEDGLGLASAVLSDTDGAFGRSAQLLLFERRAAAGSPSPGPLETASGPRR